LRRKNRGKLVSCAQGNEAVHLEVGAHGDVEHVLVVGCDHVGLIKVVDFVIEAEVRGNSRRKSAGTAD
jgi:hypothetical protein